MNSSRRHVLACFALGVLSACGGSEGASPQHDAAALVFVRPPTELTYSSNPAVYTLGVRITSNTPSHKGGAVTSYSISPALPIGLKLDAKTGVISGTPAALSATATYKVRASNAGGYTIANLTITVRDVPPVNLTYSANPGTYTLGAPIPPNTPAHGGGAVVAYSVSPALPPGLSLDPSSGVISGTPSALAETATFTITASNSGGTTTARLTVTIKDAAPINLVYSANPAIYTNDVSIAPNMPAYGGGAVVFYSVSPALPAGLALDVSSGTISGTPAELAATATYTVTAANSGGATTADLVLTVNDAPPSDLTYSSPVATYTKGVPVLPNMPGLFGGPVTSYSVTPPLPEGLSLDVATGIVSGTPSVINLPTSYTITAANSGGTTSANLTITVNDAAPADLVYTVNPAVYTKGLAIAPNLPSHTGGAVMSYSVSPPLPGGLALDATSGVISGTPSAVTAGAAYAVTATNSGGSTSATVTIRIDRPPLPCIAGGLPGLPATSFSSSYGTPRPGAVAVGDLNGDGVLDAVVSDTAGTTVTVILGKGDGTFQPPVPFSVGSRPLGVAIGDIDRDGRLDIVTANVGTSDVSLLLGNGDGTFRAAISKTTGGGSYPDAVAIGDLNGDAFPEIVVAMSGKIGIIANNAGALGSIASVAVSGLPSALRVVDLNGDGSADVAYVTTALGVLFNDGPGTFTRSATYPIPGDGVNLLSIAAADLDGDGSPELIVGNAYQPTPASPSIVAVYQNGGTGTFAAPVSYPVSGTARALAVGDLDVDGRADVAVAVDDRGTVSVLLNDGTGALEPEVSYPALPNPAALLAGDFTRDGRMDLLAVNDQWLAGVLFNLGDGIFPTRFAADTGTTADSTPIAVAMADLDGDGNQDAVVLDADDFASTRTLEIFRGHGDGTFGSAAVHPLSTPVHALAIGDLNGDGLPDAVVGDSAVSVFLGVPGGDLAPPVRYGTEAAIAVAIADLDGDGWMDLVVADWSRAQVEVFLNRKDGTFPAAGTAYPTYAGGSPSTLAIADFNHDGRPAVVAGGDGKLSLLRNTGSGALAWDGNLFLSRTPVALVAADLDQDGWPDLAVADYGNLRGLGVLLNGKTTAKLSFAAGVTYPAPSGALTGIAAGDMNGDGTLDLVLSTTAGLLGLYANSGAGAFQAARLYPMTLPSAAAVALSDLNGDHRLDVVALEGTSSRTRHRVISALASCTP